MLKGIQRIACTLLGTGLLLCMGSSGAAEDGTRTIALRASNLFDSTSEGLRDDSGVIVHDGKIVTVGGAAAIPDAAEIIDRCDPTMMRGFMTVHSPERRRGGKRFVHTLCPCGSRYTAKKK